VAGEVRGEKLTVRSEAMVCNRCGVQVLTDEQSAAYTVAVSDAYREKHGLLTSKELKAIRAHLGLSQLALARRLKVGVASVKRWESGLIQDEALDHLIRLKTDLALARQNVEELELRLVPIPEEAQETEVTIPQRSFEAPKWEAVGGSLLIGGVRIPAAFLCDASRPA
jgi:putative zinc finger/helix-turn-helix YgiT family protein